MSSAAQAPFSDGQPALGFAPTTSATGMNHILDERSHPSALGPGQALPAQRQQARSPQNGLFPSSGNSPGDGHLPKEDAPSSSDVPVAKRKRSRKGLGKRFECTIEGCGKSYSRAEHLYRHQLNHSSNQTFCCHYPDCSRTFVRGDLLRRHMDRHAARGPQLGRRDSATNPLAHAPSASESTTSADGRHFDAGGGLAHQPPLRAQSPHERPECSPYTPMSNTPSAGHRRGTPSSGVVERHGHDAAYEHKYSRSISQDAPTTRSCPSLQPNLDHYDAFGGRRETGPASYQANVTSHPLAPPIPRHDESSIQLTRDQYHSDQGNIPSRSSSQPFVTATLSDYPETIHGTSSEMMALDHMAMPGAGPVFGDDGSLNKSPCVGMPEDFMAYLFNALPSSACPTGPAAPNTAPNYGDLQSHQYPMPCLVDEGPSVGHFATEPQHVMAVHNLLDQNAPEGSLSEDKSEEIFDLIRDRFHEKDVPPFERRRDQIIGGDRNQGHHPLSRRMMQTYICSYWYHFSDQMPILHKPTFSSDQTPNLLILAMMTLGAACLDRIHGQQVATTGVNIADFLARHLRWEIFMDWSFRPPAKLWVFQALILLELYEKMYSTRELHERAHIHHATTITLMRRGRSLIGKSIADSPPHPRDDQSGTKRPLSGAPSQTAEEWWSRWIVGEATRRAAFAAFVVDTTHATMFGHSGVMAAHELRLALPCDESLWRAKSSAEVARIESNLLSQGFKPMSFLEGLKRTLSHQEVRTTSFGRTVLMAGLLSVTYHMHQRDLQVNILGSGVAHGRDKWRATLTVAYDSWKTNFDKALEQSEPSSDPYRHDAAKHEFNIVFASRTVLHHLAHMAMHTDIVNCQIFARAKRLLGRTIGPQELSSAQCRIRDSWAPSAGARDSTFYAFKFLGSVLLPGEDGGLPVGGQYPCMPYEARYDVLMNRPWVLYFAVLIVWCYGFAIEGPAPEAGRAMSAHQARREMRNYLLRFGSIADPSELQSMRGINQNTALLMVLKESFENTRWDLLHEAARLLSNCIKLNAGGTVA